MSNKKEPIKKFKALFDYGAIKDINPKRIEVRAKNLEHSVEQAQNIINRNKLNLKVKQDAEMAAYKAFEVIEL
ncbi:hypothetical protein [Pedobacter sp. Leaf170]|uniref:hypothetical protein n=1 Tax=Pedobacter sp. Leaf170 TaxID=2876558 RepID=UPI001E2A6509|nr:hypothetical protein [Pedobacter sp. Leaf170]